LRFELLFLCTPKEKVAKRKGVTAVFRVTRNGRGGRPSMGGRVFTFIDVYLYCGEKIFRGCVLENLNVEIFQLVAQIFG